MFRRKRQDERQEPPDEVLSFLTRSEAQQVRVLVREAFGERGREVIVYADHVVDEGGVQYGLWNVAAACRSAEGGRRPGLTWWPRT